MKISRAGVPSPELINLYRQWGEGGIGVIVQGNTMVQYDAVEALGHTLWCAHQSRNPVELMYAALLFYP